MDQVKQIQKKIGTVEDGIIGPNTIKKMREYWKLDREEVSHFLGQCNHETAGFRYKEENLNYSKDGLLKVFGKYFDSAKADRYKRQPEKIANLVYGGRMGNGTEETGDGYKFRGRGAIQLTGRNNYERFAQKINNLDVYCKPDLVAGPYFWDAALFYFNENNIWALCKEVDRGTVSKVTKKINGGYNGLEDRIDKTNYYYRMALKK